MNTELDSELDPDDRTVGTIFSRRQAIAFAARAGLVFAAGEGLDRVASAQKPGVPTVHLVASPSLTQGPFYVNEGLKRSDLTAASKRLSIRDACPLRLEFTLYAGATSRDFARLPGAQIEIWHTDALGVYSDEPAGLNPEDTRGENWLRGYQETDKNGYAAFKTIFPGWYRGRSTHIHFKVRFLRDNTTPATFTSQFFFRDALADQLYLKPPYQPRSDREMRNARDPVYRGTLRDGTKVGQIMTLDPKPAGRSNGYTAHFAIALVTHPHPSHGGRRVLGVGR